MYVCVREWSGRESAHAGASLDLSIPYRSWPEWIEEIKLEDVLLAAEWTRCAMGVGSAGNIWDILGGVNGPKTKLFRGGS